MKNLIFVFAVLVCSLFVFNTNSISQIYTTNNILEYELLFDIEQHDNIEFHSFDIENVLYNNENKRWFIDTLYIDLNDKINEFTIKNIELSNFYFNNVGYSLKNVYIGQHTFDKDEENEIFSFNDNENNFFSVKVNDELFIVLEIDWINSNDPIEILIPVVFVHEDVLSVEEFENGVNSVSDLRVYPNPLNVGQQLTVEFETELTDMPIEVYNMNGQKVYLNDDFRFFGNNKVSINTYDFVPGMYLVKIGTETKKIIVQ